MATPLTEKERETAFDALAATGWRAAPKGDALRKIWRFKSFSEAWGFMSRAALHAEKLDHHPDWSNSYNEVDVTLTTHSAKGITALDLKLAEALDNYGSHGTVKTDHSRPLDTLSKGEDPA